MDLNKLHKIDEELTKSEVAALKFLCMDHLGRKRLESVKDAKDLFLRFTEQDLLMDKLFLPDLLYTIRRYDLLPILDTNKTHVSKQLENQSSGVSLYRGKLGYGFTSDCYKDLDTGDLNYTQKMLYELSENVTDENLRDIKFLLHNLPKAKMASATFLEVLAEMEKTEMLGKDNLGALEYVLSNCSKELAYRVQRFKKASEITNPVYISTPGQDEENHLPVQPQDEFLPNMSIAETNPELTSSLSIESMDTDSQKLQASETSPANEINVDDCYPMTQRPVGYCLIINNHIFHPCSNLGERKGTDADKDSLTEVFQKMHFQVEERRDLLSSDMLKTVKEFSEKDHSKMDAFVCCILSHGEKGTVLGTDGKPVLIRDLTKPFACCKMLTGKPKLFFIQACQGTKLQSVWDEDGTEDGQFEYDAERAVLKSVPIEADFLIGMATVESYKSFRHVKTGSIFIQELCKYLQLGCSRNEDILSILTRVNSSVSEKELNYCKQMPEPRYTLTKKLVLPMD